LEKILLDTSVLIDYLRGYSPSKAFLDKIRSEGYESHISCLTEAELLAGKECEDVYKREQVSSLISEFRKHDIDSLICQKAGEYRRKYNQVPMDDCIIAATAYLYKLKIFTKNVADFRAIKGVLVEEPY